MVALKHVFCFSFCVISDGRTIPAACVWCFITVRTLKSKCIVLLNDLNGERCAQKWQLRCRKKGLSCCEERRGKDFDLKFPLACRKKIKIYNLFKQKIEFSFVVTRV